MVILNWVEYVLSSNEVLLDNILIILSETKKLSEKMAMASAVKVVLGSIAFAVFWILAVFPAIPFLPVGRTAGSLLGGYAYGHLPSHNPRSSICCD